MSDHRKNVALQDPPDSNDHEILSYSPSIWFRLVAMLFVLASFWLATEVWRQPGAITIIMFVGVTIIALFMVLQALVRVEFDGETLTYSMPLRPKQRIRTKQISWLEIGGRRTRALILGYQPDETGDHREGASIRFVNFPPLKEQMDLLERLGGETREDRETGNNG